MSGPQWYMLRGKVPVPCDDIIEWGLWLQEHPQERVVQQNHVGPMFVSTVFLGLNHSFDPDPTAPPILFETMILDGINDTYQTRCCTWDEAERMHEVAMEVALDRYAAALKMLGEAAKK